MCFHARKCNNRFVLMCIPQRSLRLSSNTYFRARESNEHLVCVCIPERSLQKRAQLRSFVRSGYRNSILTTFPPQTKPDEHPPLPPHSHWPSQRILLTLAKYYLVWCRLCEVMLYPSSLVKGTHTVVSVDCVA